MSERKAKKDRQRDAKRAEETVSSRKTTSLLRRRRVTLIAIAVAVLVLLVSFVNNGQEPRLTLMNKTGATLREIRVEFPGGLKTVDSLEDGGKLTLSLQPEQTPPPDAAKGLVTLQFRREDGPPFKLRSWAAAKETKMHQVFTAVSLPDGRINVIPLDETGTARFNFRGLLRRVGINL